MNRVILLSLFVIFSLSNNALAGWYEVTNYVGTVGSNAVHFSLQTFNGYSDESKRRIIGSYYYDAHRIPIRLHGKRLDNGDVKLCESSKLNSEIWAPAASNTDNNDPCPIALVLGTEGAKGTWQNNKRALPILLSVIGRFNDTSKLSYESAALFEGIMEIPMWYMKNGKMLLGVYEKSSNCDVHLNRLKVVNSVDGRTEYEKGFPGADCSTGLLATDIYENIRKGWENPDDDITISYALGMRGSEKQYTLKAR